MANNLFKLNFVSFAHSNQGSLQHRASGILSREEEKQKKKMAEEIKPTIEFFALTTFSGDSDPPTLAMILPFFPMTSEMRRKGGPRKWATLGRTSVGEDIKGVEIFQKRGNPL